jgi:hypothetical protein
MTTTPSNKASSLRKKAPAAVLTLLIITIVAGTIFAASPLSMAQQQQQQQQTSTGTTGTTTAAAPTTAPLTPEEQREQDRLKRITTAITQNLQQGQKQVNGIVYTPRWSDPVWIQPNSLSLLFVYCLPGEFAESGQHILGGSELEVLESYSLAVTPDLTGWLMIVENEHKTNRLPAAVGVICASDANDVGARVLSPQEKIEINNIIRQFITVRNTVINNITQIINIINNVTRPPPTNNTGGGGNTTEPLTVEAGWDVTTGGGDAPATLQFFADATGGTAPYTLHWDFDDGQQYDIQNSVISSWSLFHTYQNPGNYTAIVTVTDSVGQSASDSIEGLHITPPTGNGTGGNNTGGIPSSWHPPVIDGANDITVQAISPEGAPVSFQVTATENLEGDTYSVPVSCDHDSGETFPIGETVLTCIAIGTVSDNGQRHTTQESFTITVQGPPAADGGEAGEPATDTLVEEEPSAAADGEEAGGSPANDTQGQ